MSEGDLLRHLGAQTAVSLSGFFFPNLENQRSLVDRSWNEALARQSAGIVLDTCSPYHLTEVGRLLESYATAEGSIFAVGSSGLEYALTQWWRERGELPEESRSYDHVEPVSQILAMSGSASPLSAAQIDAATNAGFIDIPIDARALVRTETHAEASRKIVDEAVNALRDGKSVIMHTARGPRDTRIDSMLNSFIADGKSRDEARHLGGRLLGQHLGAIADAILRAVPLRRLILSGGDTSSQVTQVIAPEALEIDGRLAPGAPLCRVISDKTHLQNLQVALKGGQMGDENFFIVARDGIQ
jgi:uncharacterized protein YgbK (DUF1537 family)